MIFPPHFTNAAYKVAAAQQAALNIAALAQRRRVVVQAGGCSGLWPMALAQHFDTVYTFEPEPENFAALTANCAGLAHVHATQAALSDREGTMGLTRPKAQAGLWRLEGDGDVPLLPLDSLGLERVDAIVLDVEGHEVQALRGAEQTITKHRPLLWFEFLHHAAEIERFLAERGYTAPAHGIGGDWYSTPALHA
jgi:FkbM family methyltransferase